MVKTRAHVQSNGQWCHRLVRVIHVLDLLLQLCVIIIAVTVPLALLELRTILGQSDLSDTVAELLAVVFLLECLGRLDILEAEDDDAFGLLVVKYTLGDLAKSLTRLPHVVDGLIVEVFRQFGELEQILDDSILSPLVLFGSERFVDLLLIVGPLRKFANMSSD